jgi:hypothetical protein
MPEKLTPEIITAAIDGFEAQKTRIDQQIAELRGLLNGNRTEAAIDVPEAATRKRSKFSAASRRKMALAQKARWAKIKGESEPAVPTTAPAAPKGRRRKISVAGRKAIAEATRNRCEAYRAANAQPGKAAAKKRAVKKAAAARKKTAKKSPAVVQTTAENAG